MQYRTLGKTGLKVSEIGFGAWPIGGSGYGATDDTESMKALDTAWECGINFYDTADTYGHGHSETLIGKFLKGKAREEVVIASKAGWDFYHGGSKKNFDPDYLKFACDESLKRLGVEFIDVYQLHNPPEDIIRKGDALTALAKLKQAGKIRFIGVSVHQDEDAGAAMDDGLVDTLQLVFNILDQRMALNIFRLALEKNIGVIAREPLAFGFLTGKYTKHHEFPKEDHRRRFSKELLEKNLIKVEKIKSLLATSRLSLTRAALEYALQYREISTVIPGAKSAAQVIENADASNNPKLRSQEAVLLKDVSGREAIFRTDYF